MSSGEMGSLQRLYPEVDFAGGPAASVERLARNQGLAFDGLANCVGGVKLTTARGFATILLGAERRIFLVGIYESGIEWATGSTTNLDGALAAVAAWREGANIGRFTSDHPFMIPGELANAHERGNVAEAQWENLLGSGYPSSCLPLLAKLHNYEALRGLFPEISYGEIRFKVHPAQHGRGVIFVQEKGAEYRLREVGAESKEYRVGSLGEVVNRIRLYMGLG
ncbi:hypothetical protein KDL01_24405 [Actinospica durhamensis]|uniref:Uncharacterized protein n=1 Tax=Actinospica durhamensis TaxID=1508375 RepID=A0A941ISJ7_9ACTN|nr:hypothetical protein [Actinospica durhamensis]MBR7836442.1 hypothetical protein [Actinospica durhamensis]